MGIGGTGFGGGGLTAIVLLSILSFAVALRSNPENNLNYDDVEGNSNVHIMPTQEN